MFFMETIKDEILKALKELKDLKNVSKIKLIKNQEEPELKCFIFKIKSKSQTMETRTQLSIESIEIISNLNQTMIKRFPDFWFQSEIL